MIAKSIQAKPYISIYTDGGCIMRNGEGTGEGAWAAILIMERLNQPPFIRELSGYHGHTTNNEMELRGVLMGLEALKRPCTVALYSDAKYVIDGLSKWIDDWKARGWKRKAGAIANLDIWQRLDELRAIHAIDCRWVPGHAGIQWNERCDELVRQTIARGVVENV